MYLVAKAQNSGVKGSDLHSNSLHPSAYFTSLFSLADEWRNDPRNPYAAQLAKSALH